MFVSWCDLWKTHPFNDPMIPQGNFMLDGAWKGVLLDLGVSKFLFITASYLELPAGLDQIHLGF